MSDSSLPNNSNTDRPASVTNVSGGVNLDASEVTIGGDVVGRDKITQNTDTGGGANIGGNATVAGGSEFAGRDLFKVINNFFAGASEEVRDRRNKLILLDKVKKAWIEGVLEQSVYRAAMIELGKEVRPEAVERPWDMMLETIDKESHTLPKGQKISEVFEQMDHALLILGEPGSGKTVTLLELARETIRLAEKDPSEPIPVIFNLSSWAERRLSLHDWLVEELNAKYQIPRKIGRSWIEQDALMLLLDGLDEVKGEHRKECVETINRFREEHGLAYVAVCSRTADYKTLSARLRLYSAILIQPISFEQIQEYLQMAGPQLSSLREAMQHDPELRNLAQSPLMLSIMSLAYQGVVSNVFEPRPVSTPKEQFLRLFALYVQRMMERRAQSGVRYEPGQVSHWLTRLASSMQKTGQSIFLIERLQPTYLATQQQQWIYLLLSRLVAAILISIGFILEYGQYFPPDYGVVEIATFLGAVPLLTIGLMSVILDSVVLFWSKIQSNNSPLIWLMRRFLYIVFLVAGISLLFQVMVKVLPGELRYPGYEVYREINIIGYFIAVWGGIIGWKVGMRRMSDDIQPVESLHWSIARATRGALLGTVLGLILSILVIIFSPSLNTTERAANLLAGSILGGFVGGVLAGLYSRVLLSKPYPNAGIIYSGRFATFAMVAVGVVIIILNSMLPIIGYFRQYSGLYAWWEFLPIVALWFGGIEVIRHYTLRIILWLNNYAPWRYARFLDHCVNLIFLRRVGGGYIFIHRYLLEYFASLEPEE